MDLVLAARREHHVRTLAGAATEAPLRVLALTLAGGVLFTAPAFAGVAAVFLFPQLVGSAVSWIGLSFFWWGGALWTGASLVTIAPWRGMSACAIAAVVGAALLIAFGATIEPRELSGPRGSYVLYHRAGNHRSAVGRWRFTRSCGRDRRAARKGNPNRARFTIESDETTTLEDAICCNYLPAQRRFQQALCYECGTRHRQFVFMICRATGICAVQTAEGSRQATVLECGVRLPSRGGWAALPSRSRQQNTRRDCDEHEDDGAVRRSDLASPG